MRRHSALPVDGFRLNLELQVDDNFFLEFLISAPAPLVNFKKLLCVDFSYAL